MIKTSLIFFIGVCIAGCMAQKNMAGMVDLSSAKEIVYKDKYEQENKISDPGKIEQIINILNSAKMVPGKFISKEELSIKKEGGVVIVIRKDNTALRIDGVTFFLKEKQNKELSELLK